ncbi:MAG: hypothetical protein HKN56_11390 [Gammaproteobacteria bacterium]|nr:hypothetical protein [Gammaproteobacteria bacterium]
MMNLKFWAVGFLALILGACGGGGDGFTGGGTNPTGSGEVATIQVIASATSLLTDQNGASSVRITGVVRDASNNVVSGAQLVFSADSGTIQPIEGGITNDSGVAEALLQSFGNLTNRTVTVTVLSPAEGVSETIQIQVTGTTLVVDGPTNIADGDTATLTLSLRDGNGDGIPNIAINLNSANGNSFSNASPTTGPSGDVQVVLTADGTNVGSPTDTITASIASLSLSTDYVLNVSTDSFSFTSPAANTEFNLGPPGASIDIEWLQSGVAVPDGSEIEFTVDRGSLTSGSVTTTGGTATVGLSSTFAGFATLTATGVSLGGVPLADGPTTQLTVEFVADTPDTVNVQVFPDVVVTGEQATIRAIVRDADDNRVKGVDVDFNIIADPSGGQLTVSSDETDSQGIATTVYTAGNVSTPADGVRIRATVRGTTIEGDALLTVAGQAINFAIGTGNDIAEPDVTRFGKEYTVIITDVVGSPIVNEELRLTLKSIRYSKGFYVQDTGNSRWVKASPEYTCEDEDWELNTNFPGNENGSLDPGEDFNGNDQLDAGNIAALVASTCDDVNGVSQGSTQQALQTDAAGSVQVCVVYPQEYNTWLDVRLTATVSVDGGSEGTEERTFRLPGKAEDFNNLDASPPGDVSPFGTLPCTDGSGF